MNLPFSSIFKKKKDGAESAAPLAPVARVEKAPSERLSRVVRPSGAREMADSLGSSVPVIPSAATTPGLTAPRSSERTIAFPLSEIAPSLPADLLLAGEVDPQRRILLKASELERGLANGRPAVTLRTIYQQAPEIFRNDVSENDSRDVTLPVAKVLEQFAGCRPRSDQVPQQIAPEVETPFSKVANEDRRTLATPSAPAPAPPAPSVAGPVPKIAPRAPIKISLPKLPNESAAAVAFAGAGTASPATATRTATAQLPPNGTGAPAIERVPASGGPPVLSPLPGKAAIRPSVALPKIAPSPSAAPPKTDRENAEPASAERAEATVRLPLRSVLRGVPPAYLDRAIDDVPDSTEIELPLALIKPQLSSGRVALSPNQLEAALPEQYRRYFHFDAGESPIPLPLPEILRHLPNESLDLRPDQEEDAIQEGFETPFSLKAAEDAARLNAPSGPIAKAVPGAAIAATTIEHEHEHDHEQERKKDKAARTTLQLMLDTDDVLDAKSVVAHASKLPGVEACAIVSSDGLSLAGNIPAEYATDALCAVAPAIARRINDEMVGAKVGSLRGVTLFCAKTSVSLFAHDNVCLTVLHSAGELAGEVRARLRRITEEVARMYAQPA